MSGNHAPWRYVTADLTPVHQRGMADADRFTVRWVVLAADGGEGFIVTADAEKDEGLLINPRFFGGPAIPDDGVLTEYSAFPLAQATPLALPDNGRWHLPDVACRVVRMYHRSRDGQAYTLREFYPRRVVFADDIEAEMITL